MDIQFYSSDKVDILNQQLNQQVSPMVKEFTESAKILTDFVETSYQNGNIPLDEVSPIANAATKMRDQQIYQSMFLKFGYSPFFASTQTMDELDSQHTFDLGTMKPICMVPDTQDELFSVDAESLLESTKNHFDTNGHVLFFTLSKEDRTNLLLVSLEEVIQSDGTFYLSFFPTPNAIFINDKLNIIHTFRTIL